MLQKSNFRQQIGEEAKEGFSDDMKGGMILNR